MLEVLRLQYGITGMNYISEVLKWGSLQDTDVKKKNFSIRYGTKTGVYWKLWVGGRQMG